MSRPCWTVSRKLAIDEEAIERGAGKPQNRRPRLRLLETGAELHEQVSFGLSSLGPDRTRSLEGWKGDWNPGRIGSVQRGRRRRQQGGNQDYEGLSCYSVHCGTLFYIGMSNSTALGRAGRPDSPIVMTPNSVSKCVHLLRKRGVASHRRALNVPNSSPN